MPTQLTAAPRLSRASDGPRRRRRVTAVALVGLMVWTSTARADISVSGTSTNQDGSQPPAGTVYAGELNNNPPPPPEPPPVAFPGTYAWTIEATPPHEPQENFFSGSVSTPVEFFCGPGVCSGFISLYTGDSDIQTCGASCSFTTKHWARWGSVAGTVTLKNGAPVQDISVVADDGLPPNHPMSRGTQTNSTGGFTFTAPTAKALNPQGWSNLRDFDIPATNNWGLGVLQFDPDTTPQWAYTIRVGSKSQPVVVQSSTLTNVSFVFELDELLPELEEEPPNLRCDGGDAEEEEEGEQCANGGSSGGSAACPGNPVSVLTGNVFFDQTDAFLPGTVPLGLRRSYNSADAWSGRSGLFGPGWSSTYERDVQDLGHGILAVRKSNGNHRYLTERTPGVFSPYSAANGRSTIRRQNGNWERTLRSGRREIYSGNNGRLLGMADPSGNEVTFEQDAVGRILQATAPGGRSLRFTYVAGGSRISSISGPEGLIASYGYDAQWRLNRVTYPDGSGYAYSYDHRGQLTQMRDLEGVVIESHAYADGKGITSERSGGVDKLTFTYGNGRTTVRDALGNETHYDWVKFDSVKLLKKITGPCGSCGGGGSETQEWTHDDAGRIETFKNGLGRIWTYTYDADGNRDTVTDPLDRITRYTFDDRGRALTVAPPGGAGVRTFTYTAAGLATGANALGHTVSLYRSPSGAITSMTTPRLKTYNIGRNDHGDATWIRNPLNHTTTYEVDSVGRTTGVVTPLLHRTAIRYDRRGRVTGMRLPTGAEWGIRYDKGGRVVERTDALGRKTRHAYDNYGRLASVTDPLQGTTRLTYDVMSRLTAITDANGRTTRRQIDAYGRVTRVTFPDDRFESYTYYADGLLHTLTDRKGVMTTFHRDELGRLTERAFSDGSPSVTYHYDARGRVDSAANGADTLTWGYDDADRLLSEQSSFNGSAVSYSYDDDGNRETLSLDGVELATYDWDDASRFTALGWGGHTFGFDYDHDARRTLLTYPNGVSTTYGYDDDARLRSLSTTLNQTVLSGAAYTHDAVGNRLSKTTPSYAEAYGYDALDRLVNVERTAGGPGHGHFAYDLVGNRLRDQVDDAVATMVFDEGNRALSRTGGGTLTVRGQLDEPGQVKVNGQLVGMLPGNVFETDLPAAPGDNDFTVEARDVRGNLRTDTYRVNVPAGTIAYAHDDNGNLVQAVDETGTWTYEWTAENQLRRVRRDGVEVARFAYDPRGRRIEKVAGGTTIRFAYDGADILRETRSGLESGVYRHVHGPWADEPLATQDAQGSLSYHHADGLGSIVTTTDAAGSVTSRRQYDAWGQLQIGADRAGYAFTGREWDPQTGLYYYRARYYDPKLGRFISEDPIGFAGGMNVYAYVGGAPTTWADPFGLDATPPGWPTPPSNIPGGPWTWFPNPENSREGELRGAPVPGGQRPTLTWAPPVSPDGTGYWKGTFPGQGKQRYKPDGTPITADQAHPPRKGNECSALENLVKGGMGVIMTYMAIQKAGEELARALTLPQTTPQPGVPASTAVAPLGGIPWYLFVLP